MLGLFVRRFIIFLWTLPSHLLLMMSILCTLVPCSSGSLTTLGLLLRLDDLLANLVLLPLQRAWPTLFSPYLKPTRDSEPSVTKPDLRLLHDLDLAKEYS
jgi:hypothetical protein